MSWLRSGTWVSFKGFPTYFLSLFWNCCQGPWLTDFQKYGYDKKVHHFTLIQEICYLHISCIFVKSCIERASSLGPSSETTDPWYLKLVTVQCFCPLRNPIALRKAKTVCNFGLSECNRVNLHLSLDPIDTVISLASSGFISTLYLVQVLWRLSSKASTLFLLFLSKSTNVSGGQKVCGWYHIS